VRVTWPSEQVGRPVTGEGVDSRQLKVERGKKNPRPRRLDLVEVDAVRGAATEPSAEAIENKGGL